MKRFLFAMGLTGVMAVAVAAPVPKDGAKAPALLPFKVGDTWTYQIGAGPGAQTAVVVVTAVEPGKDGSFAVSVGQAGGGKVVTLGTVSVSAAAVRALADRKGKTPPPEVVVRFPGKDGAAWAAEVAVPPKPPAGWRPGLSTAVEMPGLGTFPSVEVGGRYVGLGTADRAVSVSYVPGVGVASVGDGVGRTLTNYKLKKD